MRPIVIEKDQDTAHPHYVYDMSIPMPERMQQRMFFPTGVAAANWLGVVPQRVYKNRKNKNLIWSELHNRWFAVRIAQKESICKTGI